MPAAAAVACSLLSITIRFASIISRNPPHRGPTPKPSPLNSWTPPANWPPLTRSTLSSPISSGNSLANALTARMPWPSPTPRSCFSALFPAWTRSTPPALTPRPHKKRSRATSNLEKIRQPIFSSNPRKARPRLTKSSPMRLPTTTLPYAPDSTRQMNRNPDRRRSMVLRHAQNISVRILEPRHFASTRRGPNPAFFVLHERVFLKDHAALHEPIHDRFDVVHLPAQHGALQCRERWNLRDPDHALARLHHQRKLVKAHKLESQIALVKRARLVVILRKQESRHLRSCQHVFSPDRSLSALRRCRVRLLRRTLSLIYWTPDIWDIL